MIMKNETNVRFITYILASLLLVGLCIATEPGEVRKFAYWSRNAFSFWLLYLIIMFPMLHNIYDS